MVRFLDLDGVIIDSVDECFSTSFKAYFGFSTTDFDRNSYRQLFKDFRWLVNPPYEYLCLHRAIETSLRLPETDIENLFCKNVHDLSNEEKSAFEKVMFYIRHDSRRNDLKAWMKLNLLTDFGRTLAGKRNESTYVLTTKDKDSTNAILDHFRISVEGVLSNEDIKAAGSKGRLITEFLNRHGVQQALFLDDSVKHLESVSDNRVKCYFADWGYGENTHFENYKY